MQYWCAIKGLLEIVSTNMCDNMICTQREYEAPDGKIVECAWCPAERKNWGHVGCYGLDSLSNAQFKRHEHVCYECRKRTTNSNAKSKSKAKKPKSKAKTE